MLDPRHPVEVVVLVDVEEVVGSGYLHLSRREIADRVVAAVIEQRLETGQERPFGGGRHVEVAATVDVAIFMIGIGRYEQPAQQVVGKLDLPIRCDVLLVGEPRLSRETV